MEQEQVVAMLVVPVLLAIILVEVRMEGRVLVHVLEKDQPCLKSPLNKNDLVLSTTMMMTTISMRVAMVVL